MTFSKEFNRLYKQLGIKSFRQLERDSSVANSTLNDWSKGKRPREAKDILLVAKAFNLSKMLTADLLQLANHASLATIYDSLSETDRKKLAPWLERIFRSTDLLQEYASPFFTGRDTELADIAKAINTHKIILLHGPGGVGKSSLAIEAFRQHYNNFPDGFLWANLQESHHQDTKTRHRHIHEIIIQFARDIGLDLSTSISLDTHTQEIQQALRGKHLFAILDNAHHPDDIRKLIRLFGENCLIIITTRNRQIMPDPPSTTFTLSVQPLSTNESKTLLEKIVGSEKIQAEETATQEIIKLVGGFPLALEFVGNVLREAVELSVQDYLELLRSQHLSDLPPPQDEFHTVYATFEITYQLLTPTQQRLFALLANFNGVSFSKDVIVSTLIPYIVVTSQAPNILPAHLLIALNRLHTFSFINRITSSIDQSYRYRMHALLKTYAKGKRQLLQPPIEEQSILVDLVSYYTTLVEKHAENRNEYPILEQDWGNMRDLLRRIESNQDTQPIFRRSIAALNSGEVSFLLHNGHWEANLRLLQQAINNFEKSEQSEQLLDFLLYQGRMFSFLGDYGNAKETFDKMRNLAQRLHSTARMSDSLRYQAVIVGSKLGQYKQAEELANEGLKLISTLPKEERLYHELNWHRLLGALYQSQGNTQKALDICKRVLTIAKQTKQWELQTAMLQNVGLIQTELGNYPEAEQALNEGLALVRESNFQDRITDFLINRGCLWRDQGKFDKAIKDFEEGLQIARNLNYLENICYLVSELASVYLEQNQLNNVPKLLEEGLTEAQNLGLTLLINRMNLHYGSYHLQKGQFSKSLEFYSNSLAQAKEQDFKEFQADAHYGLAQTYLALDDKEKALEHSEMSLEQFQELGFQRKIHIVERWRQENLL